MDPIFSQILVGVFISAAAGLLGAFAILKRMSLVGDALSHVALPGLALALAINVNPFVGAMMFLFVAVIGVWLLEYHSGLSVDTIVGVFFTASLALGTILLPQLELMEALLGDISKITTMDVIFSVTLSSLLIIALLFIHKKLALHMVSQEMAHSIGIKSKQLEFIYLMLFALGVALGIKFIGALLMGALIIIPAAAAKNISKSLHSFMVFSVVFGVASAVMGVYIADVNMLPAGPVFILVSTAIFILSLLLRFLKK